MTSRADVTRLTRAQRELVRMAQNELSGLFSSVDLSRPEAVRDALVEVVPLLVREYGELAATAAAEWYESVHPGQFLAQTAGTFPEDAVAQSVRYHAGALFTDDPSATLAGLSGAMQRFVFYSGRNTVARNVQVDRSRPRFARVTSGARTCAWCSLMASRGFVYLSQGTAGINDHYHDDCDCMVVAEWDRDKAHIEGYDPDRLYDMYRAAREAAPRATDQDIAAEMRRMFPGEFTDSIN